MQDREASRPPGEPAQPEIHREDTASPYPALRRSVSKKGATAIAAIALLVGAVLGWLGSAARGGNGNPDLRAMCGTLGELDTAVLDQFERGEDVDIDDPNLSRLAALPPLARAAASHADVPEALAETSERLSLEMSRSLDLNRQEAGGVREQLGELRGYC